MILVAPSYKFETPIDGENGVRILKLIESAARTCYKSEGKITCDSCGPFVRKISQVLKHESVIEHSSVTLRFIIDRACSMELIRHRIAAYSQESTRYVDYSDDKKTTGQCQFIIPSWIKGLPTGQCVWEVEGLRYDNGSWLGINTMPAVEVAWLRAMQNAEDSYKHLRSLGWSPQQARSVLPNSTKTEIVMTANLREYRHMLKMRCSSQAHPQMQEIMRPVLDEFKKHLPEIFDDITY